MPLPEIETKKLSVNELGFLNTCYDCELDDHNSSVALVFWRDCIEERMPFDGDSSEYAAIHELWRLIRNGSPISLDLYKKSFRKYFELVVDEDGNIPDTSILINISEDSIAIIRPFCKGLVDLCKSRILSTDMN